MAEVVKADVARWESFNAVAFHTFLDPDVMAKLLTLNLSGQNVGGVGVLVLAHLFKYNTVLTNLDLRDTNVRQVGGFNSFLVFKSTL